MILRRITLSLLLLLFALSVSSAGSPKYFEITFVSTNDLHAQDLPFNFPGDPGRGIPAMSDIGGLARIATVIRQVREQSPTPVIVTDAGDTTHGRAPLAKAYHGESTIAAMNVMGYDVMTVGNHEFEWHATDTLRNLKDAEFPWISANVVHAETGELWVRPCIIREFDGVRVAIFGLVNELPRTDPKYLATPELGLTVLPPEEVAAKIVPELRKKADIVVFLSHLGVGPDEKVAKSVPGIDVILGGHTHTKLATPRMVSVGERTAFSLGAVPVVQAGLHGLYVARTRLVFRLDSSGRYTLMSCDGELIPIDASIPADPKVQAILDRMAASL